jgi:hypothetical protein
VGDTYVTAAEAEADREQQRSLLTALNAWDRAAQGRMQRVVHHGQGLYSWGDGKTWIIYARCRSEKHWAYTKRRLSFCTVTQDGEDDGCLRLHALPKPD